jgi:hypothetical protein
MLGRQLAGKPEDPMRLPVNSEGDAFRLVYGIAFLVGASVLVGLATEPVWGALVFVAATLVALAVDVVARDPNRLPPLRAAFSEPHPEARDDAWRVLVVANESLDGEEVRSEVLGRAKLEPELMVVAPVLVSRTHFVTTDVDREIREARARLEATLRWARDRGLRAHGHLGDPMHPLLAIEDELRRFGADEVIVVTHPGEHANWLEAGIVDRLRDELDCPVRQVVVDLSRHRVEIVPRISSPSASE